MRFLLLGEMTSVFQCTEKIHEKKTPLIPSIPPPTFPLQQGLTKPLVYAESFSLLCRKAHISHMCILYTVYQLQCCILSICLGNVYLRGTLVLVGCVREARGRRSDVSGRISAVHAIPIGRPGRPCCWRHTLLPRPKNRRQAILRRQ